MENSGCRIILVTSCKGGVGKSSVAANLGYALALRGRRTLLVDCDLGNRCLDLILGCEDRMLYDLSDVCSGRVEVSRAVVQDSRSDRLFALGAPASDPSDSARIPTADTFRKCLSDAQEALNLDFILIDTPGAFGAPLELAASASDSAIIVATHQPTAIRAAESTASALAELGIPESSSKMLINCFDPDSVSAGVRPGVLEMIDRAVLGVLGVVPFDRRFAIVGEHGRMAKESGCKNVAAAFSNIAGRLTGEHIPLFRGWRGIKRRLLREMKTK